MSYENPKPWALNPQTLEWDWDYEASGGDIPLKD